LAGAAAASAQDVAMKAVAAITAKMRDIESSPPIGFDRQRTAGRSGGGKRPRCKVVSKW
jgi:hypothetical protein